MTLEEIEKEELLDYHRTMMSPWVFEQKWRTGAIYKIWWDGAYYAIPKPQPIVQSPSSIIF